MRGAFAFSPAIRTLVRLVLMNLARGQTTTAAQDTNWPGLVA